MMLTVLLTVLLLAATAALPPPSPNPPPPPPYSHAGPLACQSNDKYPMLPTFHIIGNVTQATDGAITLEPINDCSGVTYYKGIYHVWHQCCQNHWDHVGSDTPECSHPAFHLRIAHIVFAESGHSTGAPVLCLSLVSSVN